MRVLLISHSYTDPGYWDKLDALGQRVELAVATPATWQGYLHPYAPVPASPPGAPWRQYRLDTFWQGYGFRYVYHPAQLARAMREFRPAVVHVEEEPESLSLLQASLYKRAFGYRLIFFSWENINPLAWGWPLRRVAFGAADAGIAGNSAAAERCRRLGFQRQLALIPQFGFDVQAGEGRQFERGSGREATIRSGAPTRPSFVVGFAGRLVPEKGLRQLAAATAELPGAELLIAGSGPLEAELRRHGHVRLLGTLQRAEMEQFWEQIDVLALPSLTTPRWAEQFGRVLVEAMGRGVPVVGSNSGAIPEVIGPAGLVVPEDDSAELAQALRMLIDNAALRAELAARGLQRAQSCYGQDVIMDSIVALYRRVLECHETA
jgi:glycosyltransferase involved in cell wall biosynthesis